MLVIFGLVEEKTIETERWGRVFVVTPLRDELSSSEAEELLQNALANFRDGKAEFVLLDFSNIAYVTSPILGKLITLRNSISRTENRVHLCSVSPRIVNILEITRLSRIFPIHGNRQEALRFLTSE